MPNISGNGTVATLVASVTFPFGFVFTQLADDIDPFDIPAITIAETAMGTNGDFLTWTRPVQMKLTLAVYPGGIDDEALSILLTANRAGQGKLNTRDIITLTGLYPNGRLITFNNGVLTSGMPGFSIASSSRMKSKPYTFEFGGYTVV